MVPYRNKIDLEKVMNIDVVSYLASIGYQRNFIREQNFWYLSPLQ